jgi:hypothetical protein
VRLAQRGVNLQPGAVTRSASRYETHQDEDDRSKGVDAGVGRGGGERTRTPRNREDSASKGCFHDSELHYIKRLRWDCHVTECTWMSLTSAAATAQRMTWRTWRIITGLQLRVRGCTAALGRPVWREHVEKCDNEHMGQGWGVLLCVHRSC